MPLKPTLKLKEQLLENRPRHMRDRVFSIFLLLFIGVTLFAVIWSQWQQYLFMDEVLLHSILPETVAAQLLLIHQESIWSIVFISAQSLGILVFIALMVLQMQRQHNQNMQLQLMAKDLEKARSEAVDANRSKGDFLANMSHEVRTPFQGLIGMLNLLENELDKPTQREYLHNAYESAEHLLELINDILDISTLESGTLQLTKKAAHLPSILEEVERLMSISAHKKGLTLTVSIKQEESAQSPMAEWMMMDSRRVRQIMFNLISNAIKFTSEGEIIATFSRMLNTTNLYLFTVRDSGIGMDEETLNQLFTRFYQADTSVRRRVGGTGLGLEISRNLAQMMGGDITVTSELGVGSLFIVILQFDDMENAQPQSAITNNQQVIAGEHINVTRALRILVAEDHPLNLKFISLLLNRMGHHSTLCRDGEEALKAVQENYFDVVLLDYHMPIMDGLATSRAIRNLPYTIKNKLSTPPKTFPKEVKIILITADGLNETRQKAMLAGFDAVMLKPILEADLQQTLQQCGAYENFTNEGVLPKTEVNAQINVLPISNRNNDKLDDDINQQPLIDIEHWQSVKESLGGFELSVLVEDLFAQCGTVQKFVNIIQAGVDDKKFNIKKTASLAHQLKGACLMLGLHRLAAIATHIEGIKKSHIKINITDLENLELCIDNTLAAIEKLS